MMGTFLISFYNIFGTGSEKIINNIYNFSFTYPPIQNGVSRRFPLGWIKFIGSRAQVI